MPRRPLLVLAAALLAGCSSSSAPHVTPAEPVDPRCAPLLASVPATLPHSSLHSLATKPVSPSVRAWTSPLVVVSCGGSRPAHDADPVGLQIDGVDWTTPDEGADPVVYRSKLAGAPYLVVTIHPGVQTVTILGPLVDALKAAGFSASPSLPGSQG